MAEPKILNADFQVTVNQRFDALLKEVGPNRQQLSTKVVLAFREFHKELGKEKVDRKREGEIMMEIARIEKMAAQQLPHHLRKPAPPATVVAKKKAPKTIVAKTNTDITKTDTAEKAKPAAKKRK